MTQGGLVWALAFCAWIGFAGIALLVGTLRVKLLEPNLGERVAHVVGTILVCAGIMAAIQLFVAASGLSGTWPLMRIGAFWTVLTVAFEFVFGRLVLRKSWAALFADYNFFNGRVWLLVLLTTFYGPVVAGMLRAM
ncbi:MAG: hypothetical protein AUJ49_03035 [Desulfovibrionaceae bacterium CG1_02_65_16]|nr:MAG: hypothetical protein AUJ49_03035 [Desulfovibrionaceae bacterium CG1_02_65_16]